VTQPRDPVYERRRAQRDAHRHTTVRRRRLLAVAALVAVVAVVVAIVAVAAGGGGDGDGGGSASAPARSGGAENGGGTTPARPERVPVSKRDKPVPILMYHVINDPPAAAGLPELYVSKDDFAAQMAWLKEKRYSAVTMQQVYDLWTKGVPLPRRPVVISFDDGYLSIWTNALPIMKRHRMRGVLNLSLNELTQTDQGGISAEQVRGLQKAGWEIDSHTLTHPDLTMLDDPALRRELVTSRKRIRSLFKVPANFFCYPAGRYDPRVVAAVKAAGYLGATTTNEGNAGPDQLYTLNRVRINRSDGLEGFANKLEGLRGAGVAPAPASSGGGAGA
jgi:peptidoglycan/xylan/chitin deacetylase (PgdA/CDA1 family)